MSLKTKLTILFVAFTLISLVLFGVVVFSQAGRTLEAVRLSQLNNIADLKEDKIETFFHEREADVKSAQDFRNIRINLPVLAKYARDKTAPAYVQAKKALDDQIKTFQRSYGYLDVMLLDRHGKIIYVSNDDHAAVQLGKPLRDRKFFEEGQNKIYFTDVFFGTEGDRRIEMIGIAPVRDLHGAFVGEVALEIDMAPIFKFIQDTTGLGTTGEALIARREGNSVRFISPLLHDTNAPLSKAVSIYGTVAVPALRVVQGEDGSGISSDYRGTEVLAAWRYLPSLRWGLVTKIDAVEAFAPVRRLKVIVIAVGAFMILAGVLAATAIARSLAGPVLSLQRGTEIIGSGNLDYKVGTDAKDEVGQLSRLIDSMTGNLKKVTASRDELNKEIAERKRAEEAVRLANAYNRSLLEASLDPLVTISAEGKITDVNAATERVTGRGRAELIGTDFSDYFTDPEKARVGYQQVFREGSIMDYALEIRLRDGRLMPVLYNAAVYREESGNVVGVFAAARDITELKKAEEEIRKLNRELEARVVERTAELENSNRELEAFAYSVSHDLRTPLRSIEGFSLALLEDYADKLDDMGKSYLDRVRNATMRMGQLIDDLLKLSRITRSEMNREQVSLSALVKSIAERLTSNHPDRNVQFIIAESLTAHGDERLLTVALDNLLSNAWKFSEKTSPSVIEFGVTRKDGDRMYFVRDNGAGFDMAYAGKLFSPFQRLHKVEEFPGTGIGLATVRRIITRHGGKVWIESEVNKGTTVYFTL
jgi:PAS domain S-box-containing protein